MKRIIQTVLAVTFLSSFAWASCHNQAGGPIGRLSNPKVKVQPANDSNTTKASIAVK